MSIFDLDTDGQTTLDEQVRASVLNPEPVTPSFFKGAASATGQGILRGGARAGQFLGIAAAAPIVAFEKLTDSGPETSDAIFRALDEHINNAVDYWTPNAQEVGTAGRVIGGLSEAVLPLMAGGGNPGILMGSQGVGTAVDLTRRGADPYAAAAVGTLQAAATGVGFKLPFMGKSLATRMASGAAGNLATSIGAEAGSQAILNASGSPEQAQNFDPLNVEGRAVDVLMGMAFGAIAHVGIRSAQRDAILTANNAKHFQEDTAPGTPADVAASVAHQQAMESAVRDLLEGNPVTVPDAVVKADFVPREAVPAEVPDRSPGFLKIQKQVIAARGARSPEVATDSPAFKRWFGDSKVIDPAGQPLRVYHGTAADFDKFDISRQGSANGLMFSRGIYLTANPEYAATMGARGEAGANVMPAYVSMKNPLVFSSYEAAHKLPAREWARIETEGVHDGVIVLDNGKMSEVIAFRPEQIKSAIGNSGRFDPTSASLTDPVRAVQGEETRTLKQVVDEVRQAVARGETQPTAQDIGAKHDVHAADTERVATAVREESAPEKATDTKDMPGASIAISSARRLLANGDIQIPVVAEDGTATMRSGRELMAESDAEIIRAQNDAKGFDAAVTCFLGGA
jgi:hypothetical protein